MKRILVCLDASPRSALVLSTAVQLAKDSDGKLVLFRSVGLPAEIPSDLYFTSPDKLMDILLEQAKKDLERMAQGLPEGIVESAKSEIGAPWDAICRAAQREKVDLVVLGSHGYGGLDRLLGTTASKVVNHVDRSVLVVRPNATAS